MHVYDPDGRQAARQLRENARAFLFAAGWTVVAVALLYIVF